MAKKSKTELIKDWVQIIALAGGMVLSFYIFVYEQIIVPANKPPSIVIEGGITKEENLGDLKPVDIRIKLKNVGEGATRILAAWYNITASNVTERKSNLSLYKQDLQKILNSKNRLDRFRLSHDITAISSGKIFNDDWYLEKGEEIVELFVIFVPKRFNLLHLQVEVNFSKDASNYKSEWTINEDASIQSEVFSINDEGDTEFTYTKALFEKVI